MLVIPLVSQNETAPPSVPDKIELRKFDQSKLTDYRLDEDYNYEAYKEVESGAFQRFINRIRNWFNLLMSSDATNQLIRYGIYLLGFVALVFFVIKLFEIESNSLFKKGKSNPQSFEVSEESLDQIDFEESISKAEKSGLWRVAIRLIYLFALKDLADRELIVVKKGKTNHDYLYEIYGDDFKQNFSALSVLFDYTWYGHFEANKELVTKAKAHLIEIQKRDLAA